MMEQYKIQGVEEFQMAYGELGYDPSKLVKVNGKPEVCNIARLVNKLNSNFEDNIK